MRPTRIRMAHAALRSSSSGVPQPVPEAPLESARHGVRSARHGVQCAPQDARRLLPARRRTLAGALVLAVASLAPRTSRAANALGSAGPTSLPALPQIAELDAALAGATPRFERITLELPRLADNGNAVPMKVAVAGPFAAGAHVASISLFSEKNPVPLMARFDFLAPLARVEVESRVRLAGTQNVVALARLANGELFAAVEEIVVTIAGCLDGT